MIQFCGRTDVGRRRHRNEDSILVGDGILVVCDGMGGHQAGDVASRIGVDTIGTFISGSGADPDLTWPYGFDPSLSFDANRVRTAIKLANRAIFTRAAVEDEYAGKVAHACHRAAYSAAPRVDGARQVAALTQRRFRRFFSHVFASCAERIAQWTERGAARRWLRRDSFRQKADT